VRGGGQRGWDLDLEIVVRVEVRVQGESQRI